MVAVEFLAFVFLAGLVTALATGLGAIPFFLFEEISDRWNVALWGVASGIMVAASLFGLVREGLAYGNEWLMVPGLMAGIVLVVVSDYALSHSEIDPRTYEEADFRKLVLILGILTVHSFPEGVAIAIPLTAMGVSNPRKVWWAVFSSLPQPVGAVIAFYFVRLARQFLPFGFGFAAGAMVFLVLTEFLPEALDLGRGLPRGGRPELAAGLAAGVLAMLPLLLI